MTGLLCESGSVNQFALDISRLVEDSDLRNENEMGQMSRKRVEEMFRIVWLRTLIINLFI